MTIFRKVVEALNYLRMNLLLKNKGILCLFTILINTSLTLMANEELNKWTRESHFNEKIANGKRLFFLNDLLVRWENDEKSGKRKRYPIANTIFNILPKTEKLNYPAKEMANDLFLSFGLETYTKESEDLFEFKTISRVTEIVKGTRYRGVWSVVNKMISLTVWERENNSYYLISLSNIDKNLDKQNILIKEISHLEEMYMGKRTKIDPINVRLVPTNKNYIRDLKNFSLLNLLISSGMANEQGISGLPNTTGVPTGSAPRVPNVSDISNQVMNGDLQRFLEKFPDLSHLDPAQLGLIYNDYHNLTVGVNKLPGSIDGLSQTVNTNWSETNRILEQVTSPENLFVLSLSAAAGAVLGSAIASMAVFAAQEVVKKMVNFVHEKITHAKEKEKLIADFQEARKEYEDVMKRSIELERTIDNLTHVKRIVQKGHIEELSIDSILSKLEDLIVERQYNVEIQNVKLKDLIVSPSNKEEWLSCKKSQNKESEFLKKLESIQELLTRTPNKTFCDNIKKFYNELILVEGQLENFRADILAAKGVFFEALYRDRKSKAKKFLYALKHAKSDEKMAGKRVEKCEKQDLKNLKNLKKVFLESCEERLKSPSFRQDYMDFTNSDFSADSSIFKKIFNRGSDLRNFCKSLFEKYHGENYCHSEEIIKGRSLTLVPEHKKYSEALLDSIFKLDQDPDLDRENNLANLDSHFKKILDDQIGDRVEKVLNKKNEIIKYCGKL